MHRRSRPSLHQFSQRVAMVWLDPDDPGEIFDQHWLASRRRPAPLRFTPSDHGTADSPFGTESVRAELAEVGVTDVETVRLLTQPRRWGWLFNPISLYVAWGSESDRPIGAVAEVTNTPWKQRHRYAVPLSGEDDGVYAADFDKAMHVSPFLNMEFRYRLRLSEHLDQMVVEIDVSSTSDADGHEPILETRLVVDREPVNRRSLRRFALTQPLSTYLVSAGIHTNAAALWRKRVPFVGHPNKNQPPSKTSPMINSSPSTPTKTRQGRDTKLLGAAPVSKPVARTLRRAARATVLELARRIETGRIDIVEGDGTRSFGTGDSGVHAAVRVLDDRAWWALVTEGSVGLGRGYFEGWWDSDDPVAVVRLMAANVEPLHRWQRKLTSIPRLGRNKRVRDVPQRDREDIAAHYDIGTDFFSLFLDETLTYSSGVFAGEASSLLDASLNKYDRILDKLDVQPGDRVLEIGTGWGGFAIRAAQTRGCHVTTTTISQDQRREAISRIESLGLSDRVEVLDSDWRDLSGQYDKIVSIEMIEAVDWRDYDDYFATIERCLSPSGAACIQAICVPGSRFEMAKHTEDFIKHFIFPGGGLPSIEAIARSLTSSTRMHLVDVEDLSSHYARTLNIWRDRFDEREADVKELGFDHRFIRLWRFYLAYCEAGFAERHCTLNQLVFVGKEWRPSGVELRVG